MSQQTKEALRMLPGVDEVLRSDEIRSLLRSHPRRILVEAVRSAIGELREKVLAGEIESHEIRIDRQRVEAIIGKLGKSSLDRVINATGVVVHTNLGRAPLPLRVVERIAHIAAGYCTLEYDLEAGVRGSRHTHVKARLSALLGAEDALVVNNNAAAVLLCLAALASGREVLVSYGELVEIGGSFRIPDVMRQSGAVLKEVGTTNRTRIDDYESAITDRTALILKVHRSNFALVGFSEEASSKEIAELGRVRSISTMEDLGSGCIETAFGAFPFGRFPETGARSVIEAGMDVTTFSGDKLLGGPQAGVIVGKASCIAPIRSHPLMRAVRPGKLTLAAMDALLSLYECGCWDEIPTIRMICTPLDELKRRRDRLLRRLRKLRLEHVAFEPVRVGSVVGGGAQPLLEIPSEGIAILSSLLGTSELERRLRLAQVPIICRIHDRQVILDMRTMSDQDLDLLVSGIKASFA